MKPSKSATEILQEAQADDAALRIQANWRGKADRDKSKAKISASSTPTATPTHHQSSVSISNHEIPNANSSRNLDTFDMNKSYRSNGGYASDEDAEPLTHQDMEEARRELQSELAERASLKTASVKIVPWPVVEDSFILPNALKWPHFESNDTDVLKWVFENSMVLTRLVTWNLEACPPPPVELVQNRLLPLNKYVYIISIA